MGDASNKEQAMGCIGVLAFIALVIAAFVVIGNYREAQAEKDLPPTGFFERIELFLRPHAYAEKEIARVERIVEAQQNLIIQATYHNLKRNLPEIAEGSFDAENAPCDDFEAWSFTSYTSSLFERHREFEHELESFADTAVAVASSRRNVRAEIYEALPDFAGEDGYFVLEDSTYYTLLRARSLSNLLQLEDEAKEVLCLSMVDVKPVVIYSHNSIPRYPFQDYAKGEWEPGKSPVVLSVQGHPQVPKLPLRTLTYQLFSSETSPTPSRRLFSAAPFLTFSNVEIGEEVASVTELQATCPEEASYGDVYTTTFYAFPTGYENEEPTQAFSFPVIVVCQNEQVEETPEATALGTLSQATLDDIDRVTYCGSALESLSDLRSLRQKSWSIQDMQRQDYDDDVAEVLSRLEGYDVRLANEEAIANTEIAFMAEFQEARAILDASCYRDVTVMNDVVIAESERYESGDWGRFRMSITIEVDTFLGDLPRLSRSSPTFQIVRLSSNPETSDVPLPKYDSLSFYDSFVRMRDGAQFTSSETLSGRCPESAQVGDEYHATYYAYPLGLYERLKGFEFDVTFRCVAESQD